MKIMIFDTEEVRGPFGSFLHRELKCNRGESAQWLTNNIEQAGIKLDSSLVRHWIRGSRVPSLGHPAIAQIAKLLKKEEKEVEGKQLEALKWNEEKKKQKKVKKSKKEQKPEPELLAKPDESPGTAKNLLIKDCRKELQRPENKNAKSHAIEGARDVMETTISILESLPDVPSQPNKQQTSYEVLLTIQGQINLIEKFEDLEKRWYDAIKSALKKSWKVSHIVRIDNKLERIKRIVSKILQLVGYEGNYELFYFNQKYVLPVAQSFLIIPSRNEGMMFYAGEQSEYVDSAIYIHDKAQIELIQKHFLQLKNVLEPVFLSYAKYSEITETLSRADQQPGKRIVILKRLSDIQRPKDSYHPDSRWAKAHKTSNAISSDELSLVLDTRKKRQENLEIHSNNYCCKYIYTGGCLQNFVETGKDSPLEEYKATLKDRLEHLVQFNDFFNCQKYEMALLEEEIFLPLGKSESEAVPPAIFPEIMPEFCEVQDDHLVLMQFWIKGNDGENLTSKWIIIREPIIVRAFYEYLSDKWEEIPNKRRDRFYVSRWFDREIEKIKETINGRNP